MPHGANILTCDHAQQWEQDMGPHEITCSCVGPTSRCLHYILVLTSGQQAAQPTGTGRLALFFSSRFGPTRVWRSLFFSVCLHRGRGHPSRRVPAAHQPHQRGCSHARCQQHSSAGKVPCDGQPGAGAGSSGARLAAEPRVQSGVSFLPLFTPYWSHSSIRVY